MPQTLGKRDDDEQKKGRLAISFRMEIFCSLICFFLKLAWFGSSRERCIAVNNNHENGEYVRCCSSMKSGNLGDTNNVEMYIFKNCLYKYMYFWSNGS